VPGPEAALRRGWTTGACATAATKAAYGALLGLGFPATVTLRLPRGQEVTFVLAEEAIDPLDGSATAGVIKDAGDDPDVTHGCLVRATLRRGPPASGVTFRAGEGVGTVTRPGLAIPPGEPAINPVPRAMMREVVAELALTTGDAGDVAIALSIPEGEALARRTLNARLGIVGGLSILGTTGIVVPYSCSSWIHSIHRGIDVARAAGLRHVVAATGTTSERAVAALYGLPEMALVEMGDFVGATLKYLRRNPVPHVSVAGGFAKLAKLAQGHLDLHSARSTVDLDWLSGVLCDAGGPSDAVSAVRQALTAAEALRICIGAGIDVGSLVAERARRMAQAHLGEVVRAEVIVVGRDGRLAGRASGW
jgi:cobalt-precorrin-5B (C1)-methyltransferase